MTTAGQSRPSILHVVLTWLLVLALLGSASPCLAATSSLSGTHPKQASVGPEKRVWQNFCEHQKSAGESGSQVPVGVEVKAAARTTIASETPEGRFWNMDAWEGTQREPLTLHKFLYGAHDPVSYVDPSGLSNVPETSSFVAIAATLARSAAQGVSRAIAYVYFNAAKIDSVTKSVVLWSELVTTGIGVVLAAAAGVDSMCAKLLENDRPVTGGYGLVVEEITEANLRGNVEAIDDYDPRTGAAISVKSHNLDSPEKLVSAILSDLDDLDGIENRRLVGKSHDGRRIDIPPGSIKAKGLVVAIPQDRAAQALHPAVRSILISYRQNYNVMVRVVPVRMWFSGGKR